MNIEFNNVLMASKGHSRSTNNGEN